MPSVLLERYGTAGVSGDELRNLSFSGLSKPCSAGSLVEVVITAHGDAKGKIVVHALPPSGQSTKCQIHKRENVYTAQFTPYEVGKREPMSLFHCARFACSLLSLRLTLPYPVNNLAC
ncbi:unnamed protein product [Soboliphyme baturini]|uniref:SHSP domain-containing protein n=1 Tax=Soboliphyme baturini TaxID=241478 RepID=A0A183J9V0_9BILA|nr:unnamed protein product [Soboliphyme baturini]